MLALRVTRECRLTQPAPHGPFFVVMNGGSGRAAVRQRCALLHEALTGVHCVIEVARGGRQLSHCIDQQTRAARAVITAED